MKEINIVNLTNTTIKLYPDEYTDIEIPVKDNDKQRLLARCIDIHSTGHARAQITRDGDTISAIVKGVKGNKKVSLSYSHIGVISGLPPQKENTIYIVSQLTFNATYHTRKDIYIIDKPIRAINGGIIACRGLSRCVYDKDNEQLNVIERYLKRRFAELSPGNEADIVSHCIISLNEYRKK